MCGKRDTGPPGIDAFSFHYGPWLGCQGPVCPSWPLAWLSWPLCVRHGPGMTVVFQKWCERVGGYAQSRDETCRPPCCPGGGRARPPRGSSRFLHKSSCPPRLESVCYFSCVSLSLVCNVHVLCDGGSRSRTLENLVFCRQLVKCRRLWPSLVLFQVMAI